MSRQLVAAVFGSLVLATTAAGGSAAQIQHGASQGVRVDVYASGTVVFDLRRIAATPRRLLTGPHGLMYGCLKASFRRGLWNTGESEWYGHFRRRIVLPRHGPATRPAGPVPPYDGCELGGLYGHRWWDGFGTRNAVEIALTARGRHFFNDRAAARDLAYFVRSGQVHRIRTSPDPRPALEAIMLRYPGRFVELGSPTGRVARHRIGFWIGPRTIVFTTTSSTKLRLFVVAKRGSLRLPKKNLGDLAFVF